MNNKNIELTNLASEILQNIELGDLPISKIISKSLKLARLRGDFDNLEWLKSELSGYETAQNGSIPDMFEKGKKSGRHYQQKDEDGKFKNYFFTESVGLIETEIEIAEIQLKVTPLSPHSQHKLKKWKNLLERIKASLYEYVLEIYFELRFGTIIETVFEKTKKRVDGLLSTICPYGIKELIAAYDNLISSNETNWSNTANSCRRLLKDLADILYPPRKYSNKEIQGRKLTEDAYINRLMQFIKEKANSEKFEMIIGSQLNFIADRLDAIKEFAGKGVHYILSKEEAERILIYTYLLIGDILSLISDQDLVDIKNLSKEQ